MPSGSRDSGLVPTYLAGYPGRQRQAVWCGGREDACAWPLVPDSVSQRFRKQAQWLGIKSSLHKLRHYNATELLAAGVDLRTVAGRLGHGGGTTTLKVSAAWMSEAASARPERLQNSCRDVIAYIAARWERVGPTCVTQPPVSRGRRL
jgi:Phage integrase family